MFDFSTERLFALALRLPIIVLALSIHEFAHAWSAWKLGDPTAKSLGRVTLNPIHHLDPIGFLCLLFAPIGWAKPVPVNPLNFRRPGRDDTLVSIAGPVSNVLQAMLFILLLRLPWERWAIAAGPALPVGVTGNWEMSWIMQSSGGQRAVLALWAMVSMGALLNIGLAVFNMLPFAPLDGHHVARENLRGEMRERFIEFQRFGPLAIIALIVLDNMMGRQGSLGPISWPIVHLLRLLLSVLGGQNAHLFTP